MPMNDNNVSQNYILQKINQGVTAAAVMGNDAPPSHSKWRYSNLVGLGIVEPKKPIEKHWTYSEGQRGMYGEDDEVMDDAPREPSELGLHYENQYKPPNHQQAAPRQDALRQDALRQDVLRQDALRQDALRQDVLRQDAPRQDSLRQDSLRQDSLRQDSLRQGALRQDVPRHDIPRQDTPRLYRNDDLKLAKDTSAKPNIAEVTFRLVGSGFRRAEALIVDINSSNSTDMSSSYYPNSSSSSPASANSPSTPDDPLLSPLLELNEALTSQVKTVKSSKSSDSVKAKPDNGGWKESWAQGYADIW
ncbi:10052_t:CDS:2 [Paraglomus occultum]|uniref:10052_t:CDS:1 n=1 Tax=Paraglomus occultum TaxID=144539 RepID=A0A9N8ZG42_9GLOM|nr:10052_t:CDS:2 [Paraglomus occultum]